jgi:PPOX class probable FMN-dependent enzyme
VSEKQGDRTERPPEEEKDYLISDMAALEALYGPPVRTARQESNHLHEAFRDFVQRSPFLIIATHGPQGVDASAKGDPGGFVHVTDETTLLIPERGANGRNDSLRNIVCNPQVALAFFVPGTSDLLRVSGKAYISTAPDLLARFPAPKPRAVIAVKVEECFMQCSRAIQRSDLWRSKSV